MTAYPAILCSGLFLSALLYALRLEGPAPRRAGQAALTVVLMAVMGFLCAKAFYVLALARAQFARHGIAAFVRLNMEEFSVFGGGMGVVLAVALTARWFRVPAGRALDAFAPGGALLLMVVRAAEYFIGNRFLGYGLIGMGTDLSDGSVLCFFPMAVQDGWGTWFFAVFALETVVALIALLLSFTAYRRYPFLRTVFFVMALQIFCESLHSQSLRWGFVRVEQVFCAIGVLAVVALHCAAWRKKVGASLWAAYGWCLMVLLLIGVDVGVEFALDKPALVLSLLGISTEGGFPSESVTAGVSYGVMLLSIAGMLAVEHVVVKRRAKAGA